MVGAKKGAVKKYRKKRKTKKNILNKDNGIEIIIIKKKVLVIFYIV